MRLNLSVIFLLSSITAQPCFADRYDEQAFISELAKQSYLSDAATENGMTVLVGERGHVLYKKKQDTDWLQATVPTRTNLNAISMSKQYGQWAVGHDSLVIKSNKMDEWTIAIQRKQLLNIALDEIKSQKKSNTIPSGMEESVEFLKEELSAGIESGIGNNLFDISIGAQGRGLIVGAFGIAFSTVDGGENWKFIGSHLSNPDSLHLYSTLITEQGEMFIVGESGLLFTSSDSVNWRQVELPYLGTLLDIHRVDATGELFIVGMGGKLLKSSDNGVNWEQIQLPSKTILQSACSSEDGTLYLAGLGGFIYQLKDQNAEQISFAGKQHLSAIVCEDEQLFAIGQGGIHPLHSSQTNNKNKD